MKQQQQQVGGATSTTTAAAATTTNNNLNSSSATASSSQTAQRKQLNVSTTHVNQNPNLLSPNAAVEPALGPNQRQQQQRKKSTLSANGFFIDYSCTRRRSSAAFQHCRLSPSGAAESVIGRSQFLSQVMGANSYSRRPSSMVTHDPRLASSAGSNNRRTSSATTFSSKPNSPARNSRPSYCGSTGGGAYLLPPGLHQAPAALSMVGSRKTSMFDPTGHSLASVAQYRRKSTLANIHHNHHHPRASVSPAFGQAATMMTVARNAAAIEKSVGRTTRAKSELVQRVPVIGCSPTSIKASLAALEETRRYEKLLRKLKRHQKHKEKRRKQLSEAVVSEDDDDDDAGDDYDHDARRVLNESRQSFSLRRKSLRAIKDATALMNRTAAGQLNHWHKGRHHHRRHRRTKSQDPFVDGLSISSTLSFASSQTSLPSIDRFLDECEMALYDDEDDYEEEEDEDDDDEDYDDEQWASFHPAEYHEPSESRATQAKEVEGSCEQQQQQGGKKSFVRKAMRKLASTIVPSRTINATANLQSQQCNVAGDQKHQRTTSFSATATTANNKPAQRRRSISMSTGLNYWHYYYYLRGNSFDAIDDLPLGAIASMGGGGDEAVAGSAGGAGGAGCSGAQMSESERRTRLYVNYSLARLDILNSSTDPAVHLADKLAKAQQQQADWPSQQQQSQNLLSIGDNDESPIWNQLFDFSQSTDVSLSLSTASTDLESSDTSRNSSSLSSPVHSSSSSSRLSIPFRSGDSNRIGGDRRKVEQQQQQHQKQHQQPPSNTDHFSPSRCSALSSTNLSQFVDSSSPPPPAVGRGCPRQSHNSNGYFNSRRPTGQLEANTLPNHSVSSHSIHSVASVSQPAASAYRSFEPLSSSGGGVGQTEQQQLRAAGPYLAAASTPSNTNEPATTITMPGSSQQPAHMSGNLVVGGQFEQHNSRISRQIDGQLQQQQRHYEARKASAVPGGNQLKQHENLLAGKEQHERLQDEIRCNESDDHVANHQYKMTTSRQPQQPQQPKPCNSAANEEESNDDEEDDFERFNRFYKPTKRLELEKMQEQQQQQGEDRKEARPEEALDSKRTQSNSAAQTTSRGVAGRDSHFRLSVKSSRSSGDNSNGSGATRNNNNNNNAAAAANSNRPARGSMKTRKPRGDADDHAGAKHTRSASGGGGGSLRARAFLSWDALTCNRFQSQHRSLSRGDFRDCAPNAEVVDDDAKSGPTKQQRRPAVPSYGRRSFRLHYNNNNNNNGGGGSGSGKSDFKRDHWRALPMAPPTSSSLSSSTTLTTAKTISSQRQPGAQRNSTSAGNVDMELRRQHCQAQATNANDDDDADHQEDDNHSAGRAEALQQQQQQQQQFEAQMNQAANLAPVAALSESGAGSAARHQASGYFMPSPPPTSSSAVMLSNYCDAYNQNNRQQPAILTTARGGGGLYGANNSQERVGNNNNSLSASNSDSTSSSASPREAGGGVARGSFSSQQTFNSFHLNHHRRLQQQANATLTSPNPHETSLSLGRGPVCARARSQTNVVNLDIDGESGGGGQGAGSVCLSSFDVNSPSNFADGAATEATRTMRTRIGVRRGGSDEDRGARPNWPPGSSTPPPSCSSWLSLHTSPLQQQQQQQQPQLRQPQFAFNVKQTSELSQARLPSQPRLSSANGRRVTSASLRAPKWQEREHQQRQQQELAAPIAVDNYDFEAGADDEEMKSIVMGQQQLDDESMRMEANRRVQQRFQTAGRLLAPENEAVRVVYDNNDTEFAYDDGGDQPRARAYSTGANNGNVGLANSSALKDLAHQVARDSRAVASSEALLLINNNLATRQHRDGNTNYNYARGSNHKSDDELMTRQQQQQQLQQSRQTVPMETTAFSRLATTTANGDDNQAAANEPTNRERNDLIENERALFLLRKNSFTCMLVGARQTGKRTIVKCFIKLLNEFKLAAEEYKKEKVLSKLVGCSERLQELANEQHEQQQQADQLALQRAGRSRLNSWLGGGRTVNKLLNLSPKSKRRLHSVVGIWPPKEDGDDNQAKSSAGNDDNVGGQQQHQRRHTTIVDHPSFQQQEPTTSSASTTRWLEVDRQTTNLLTCNNNKSDSNVNYSAGASNQQAPGSEMQQEQIDDPTVVTTHQLQVPVLGSFAQLRKHSDPTNGATARQQENDGRRVSSSLAPSSCGRQPTRRHTSATFDSNVQQQQQQRHSMNLKLRTRKQSLVLTKRRKKILLSLKELNRRRCGIKFKTRRQISETCLEQLRQSVIEDVRRRASVFNRSALMQADMPVDSFIVVYSINDRESFEYAKTLIGQLRAHKQDVPMPIVLVANKIDLERARVVKREEGRTLARKNSCKFMEISCTIGFNLDNLLVGLRTQLILRHHIILNSILLGKIPKNSLAKQQQQSGKGASGPGGELARRQQQQQQQTKESDNSKTKASNNILVRFYKRYVIDNSKQDYDCDNFSKL